MASGGEDVRSTARLYRASYARTLRTKLESSVCVRGGWCVVNSKAEPDLYRRAIASAPSSVHT